jgi:HAD superfamily hydrolase (TIGR01549 family)
MLNAIFWDFDGTICDTYPAIARAVNAALATFGASASLERVIELASISLDGCVRILAQEHRIPYQELDAAFTETYKDVHPSEQIPFPGLVKLFDELSVAGVPQFIVTHRRRRSLVALLDTHKLQPYFTSIIAADDGFPKKPAPDALIYLLETYRFIPTDVLLIGDRDLDILAGHAAGMPTCLFRSSFAGIQPTYTFTDYNELATIIQPMLRQK